MVVSIPKEKWEVVTAEDLENAEPEIQPGDIVIVNTGWHRHYGDNADYYAYSPGFYEDAGEWFAERGVKAVGTDTQALDHPLATAIAPHGPGWPHGLLPWACAGVQGDDRARRAARTSRSGSRATARCCRTASSGSRTSAATSTPSPASG